MTILERLNADIVNARLAKNKTELSLLITLKGELERGNKITKDEDVILAIKRYLNGLVEQLKQVSNIEFKEKLTHEMEVIRSRYLPRELSYDELLDILSNEQFDNIGQCMAFVNKYQKENGILINRGDAKNIFDSLQ